MFILPLTVEHIQTTLARDGVLKPYVHQSRVIALTVHPFANIHRVFYAGVSENDDPAE